jgi:sulfopropanediol 3-dehydrogenase
MIRKLKSGLSEGSRLEIDRDVGKVVDGILTDIAMRGDAAVRELSETLDTWSPPAFLLSQDDIADCMRSLPSESVADIQFAQAQIRNFALAQRVCIRDLEIETLPGVTLGHRNLPVNSVGCYVPGGRYPLVASAHMGVVTAKAAGVKRVIACTPPFEGKPNAATVTAMHVAGADEIYILGGVQAIGAMALGIDEIAPVDMIVGPGNTYVAEAKRQLFGRVGIDLLAGPTETLIIADGSCDAEMAAVDLLGRAEHGPDSTAVLLTNSTRLAAELPWAIEALLRWLPAADVARIAWDRCGQVILVDSIEELLTEADRIASEHVQVITITADPDYFLANLTNYGRYS